MKRYGKITALILSAFMCVQIFPCNKVYADDQGDIVVEEESAKKSEIDLAPEENSEWYKDYEYELSDGEIIISDYIGSDTQIYIPKTAIINGVEYHPVFKSQTRNTYYFNCSIWANKTGDWGRPTSDITSIVFEEGFVFYGDLTGLFHYCQKLESITWKDVDTSQVTNMNSMFSQCSNLINLDVSGFNTSNCSNMSDMFDGCINLKTIDVSGFNTSKVTSFGNMFCNCKSLENIDVSGFDTKNMTSFLAMFKNCSSLKRLDLSSFITSKVEGIGEVEWDMRDLFNGCSSLNSIDVSSFDTSNIHGMQDIFLDCNSLIELDLSNWDMRSVENVSGMLKNCNSLQAIDVPINLVSDKAVLPYTFYDTEGKEYNTLPSNLSKSIRLTKNKVKNGWIKEKEKWIYYKNDKEEKYNKVFTDVCEPTKYYLGPVYWALDNGITKGTTATTFSPDNPCTRGQFVTFLWRLAGEPKASKETQFNDVKNKEAYYYKAVMWAAEEGITTGTGKGNFSPDDVCTRAQCVTFIYRAAGKPNVSEEVHNKYSFTDVKKSDFSYDPVAWAASQNITTGVGNNRFAPNDKCNRGMLVTFLYRYAGE